MQSNLPNTDPLLFRKPSPWHGPETRRRLRRSATLYAALFGAAALLLSLTEWSGLALGLMAPGAGFASGGAMLGGVALFGVAVLIWFATGNVLLPPLVWLGAALLATDSTPAPAQKLAVPPVILLGFATCWLWQHRAVERGQRQRDHMNAHIAALPAATSPADALCTADELTPQTLPDCVCCWTARCNRLRRLTALSIATRFRPQLCGIS